MLLQFDKTQFDRLFPFYILLDKQLMIIASGAGLNKLFPKTKGRGFVDCFSIPRPVVDRITFSKLTDLQGQLVVIESNNASKTSLRGQIEFLKEQEQLLFIGSPWFGSIEQVIQNGLTIHDFAFHDPLIDLLHVIKTNEIANNDLKDLLKTINNQKTALKNANKEIHEIALFPTENPDPLIRINLDGALLRRNPAAEALHSFEFEGKTFTFEDLFSHVAPLIDLNQERWVFEAKSGDTTFSFVCKAIKESGYINIYGRNITQAKKDQEELKRLSLIIHETRNAVIVTDAKGRVEWANNAFYKVTGYTLDEMKGKTPGSVLQGPETSAETVRQIREQLRQEKPFVAEIYNYKKNGDGYWLRINAQPIKNKEGVVTNYFAIEEDITFEREAQLKLQAAASRMSSLITSLNAGILLENQDRTIALINQRFCQLFDIPVEPSMLVGTDCSQSAEQSKHHFKDPVGFVSRIEELLEDKKLVTGDVLELVDGRYYERDFVPIFTENRYEGHLWVYTDITEKMFAEKRIKTQREFYEKILDNIPADIAVFDTEQRYLYVNPQGINDPVLRKKVIGQKEETFFHLTNKDQKIALQRKNRFEQVVQSKRLSSWEENLKKDDGTETHALLNLYPVLNNQEEVELVIGYGVDITEIKNIQKQILQSEKRYRDVIDNSLAIITTHDMDGRFITINPMVSKTYGYSHKEIIGRSIYDFMPEEDKTLFHASYMKKIRKDKNYSGLFRVRHKDGHIVYTLFNNFLKEEPGKEPYIIGFAVDITDRVKVEKELEIAKKTTERLAQTKQNFLANMSHEIRTPMNAIIGMANFLNKTSLNDKQRFYLNTIQSAADNLLVIINDILDLSKIEAGKLSIENIGFEPSLIVERALQVMNHKAEEKGLSLTNSYCDSKLSPVLIGDPFRLNQILLNLLSNAIKFTERGSVDVVCEVIDDQDENQVVKTTIKDTGIGMDQEFVKTLFQKFTQEDASVTRKFGGTGLGMNITRELIELMQGKIEVESYKGFGTRVSFTIPFKKGSPDLLKEEDKTIFDANILHGKHILVTDDNEMNRLVASTLLKSYGATVDEAVNGKDAYEKIETTQYDVVLMDVQMPVMDGIEATKKIRATINKTTPIIALTAFALKGDSDKFLAAGMNDYLSKPFEEEQFISMIAKHLGKENLTKIKPIQVAKKPKAVAALYDLTQLETISRGNKAFIDEMISLFIDQVAPSINEINSAFASGDYSTVKKIAHRVKPSIESMGIVSLSDEVRKMESSNWDEGSAEELQRLIRHFETTLIEVVEQLKIRN